MSEEYSKEQLWKLYEALPEELQTAIFSQETADSIYNACSKNGIKDEGVSEVAKYVGYVLLGLLPPDEFEKTLKEKLNLKNDVAKKISQAITRFAFYPLKETLESMYKTEIEPAPKAPERTLGVAAKPNPQEKPSLEAVPKEKPPVKRAGRDVYRETIE